MSSWWLIVGIVAGLLLLALIIMLATRSKESKSNYLVDCKIKLDT